MATKTPELVGQREAKPLPQPQRTTPASPRKWIKWLVFLVLGALGYAGYRYYQTNQQKQQAATAAQASKAAQRSIPVMAAPARSGDLPLYLHGLGTVAAFNSVTVKSRVDGQLIAIHFTEGQYVNKGDLLAEIDPRAFQVQLDQAKGQMARDQAQLNDAKANLGRYQALFDAQVIPKQQLDTQRASVGQFEGTIEADQATIGNAQLNLTYAKITAPISGRIGLRLVDVGNIVHASDPNGLLVIAQLQPISVLFTIPADNLPPVLAKLRSGARLRVDAYDRDDKVKIATGVLMTVDNQIDQATGTARLKAQFDNADSALFPNQFVNSRLLLDTKHAVTIVPAPAIQRGPQGTYVYVVSPEGKATLRLVTPGITEGADVEIEKGVNPGEPVVIDGQDKLLEGSKVDVRTPGGSSPGGGKRRTGQGGSPSGRRATQ